MPTDPEGFLEAADDYLRKVEESKLVSEKELEQVRKEIVRDLKRDAKDTVRSMQTAKVGALAMSGLAGRSPPIGTPPS